MARDDRPTNPETDRVNLTTQELLDRLAANLSRLSPDRLDAFGEYLDGQEIDEARESDARADTPDDAPDVIGDDPGDDQGSGIDRV